MRVADRRRAARHRDTVLGEHALDAIRGAADLACSPLAGPPLLDLARALDAMAVRTLDRFYQQDEGWLGQRAVDGEIAAEPPFVQETSLAF